MERRPLPGERFPHRRAATRDHIIPKSKGGSRSQWVWACYECNHAKGSLMPEEWADKLALLAQNRGYVATAESAPTKSGTDNIREYATHCMDKYVSDLVSRGLRVVRAESSVRGIREVFGDP